ncbi:MAG: hypothetical protein ACKO6N_17215 [Myxococcota bacterium]
MERELRAQIGVIHPTKAGQNPPAAALPPVQGIGWQDPDADSNLPSSSMSSETLPPSPAPIMPGVAMLADWQRLVEWPSVSAPARAAETSAELSSTPSSHPSSSLAASTALASASLSSDRASAWSASASSTADLWPDATESASAPAPSAASYSETPHSASAGSKTPDSEAAAEWTPNLKAQAETRAWMQDADPFSGGDAADLSAVHQRTGGGGQGSTAHFPAPLATGGDGLKEVEHDLLQSRVGLRGRGVSSGAESPAPSSQRLVGGVVFEEANPFASETFRTSDVSLARERVTWTRSGNSPVGSTSSGTSSGSGTGSISGGGGLMAGSGGGRARTWEDEPLNQYDDDDEAAEREEQAPEPPQLGPDTLVQIRDLYRGGDRDGAFSLLEAFLRAFPQHEPAQRLYRALNVQRRTSSLSTGVDRASLQAARAQAGLKAPERVAPASLNRNSDPASTPAPTMPFMPPPPVETSSPTGWRSNLPSDFVETPSTAPSTRTPRAPEPDAFQSRPISADALAALRAQATSSLPSAKALDEQTLAKDSFSSLSGQTTFTGLMAAAPVMSAVRINSPRMASDSVPRNRFMVPEEEGLEEEITDASGRQSPLRNSQAQLQAPSLEPESPQPQVQAALNAGPHLDFNLPALQFELDIAPPQEPLYSGSFDPDPSGRLDEASQDDASAEPDEDTASRFAEDTASTLAEQTASSRVSETFDVLAEHAAHQDPSGDTDPYPWKTPVSALLEAQEQVAAESAPVAPNLSQEQGGPVPEAVTQTWKGAPVSPFTSEAHPVFDAPTADSDRPSPLEDGGMSADVSFEVGAQALSPGLWTEDEYAPLPEARMVSQTQQLQQHPQSPSEERTDEVPALSSNLSDPLNFFQVGASQATPHEELLQAMPNLASTVLEEQGRSDLEKRTAAMPPDELDAALEPAMSSLSAGQKTSTLVRNFSAQVIPELSLRLEVPVLMRTSFLFTLEERLFLCKLNGQVLVKDLLAELGGAKAAHMLELLQKLLAEGSVRPITPQEEDS